MKITIWNYSAQRPIPYAFSAKADFATQAEADAFASTLPKKCKAVIVDAQVRVYATLTPTKGNPRNEAGIARLKALLNAVAVEYTSNPDGYATLNDALIGIGYYDTTEAVK